eukprot:TRINITY_DN42123_c0_g1_i1.p1 TRINITY_DN42123_c0_g1~~TRINITY_DN42123_c0_g1_i1.p1  ORF type:complete len:464 (-),score=71.92 TRINITY_DN42123_c0_g1_i1:196-1587(-)
MIGSMNLSCSRSSFDVLARVADDLGVEVILEDEGGDVLWAGRREDAFAQLLSVKEGQLLNRIPGMSVACEKLSTHACLSRGCPLPFWPATWAYTGTKAEMLSARIFQELTTGAHVIVKPSRTAKGIGIVVACNQEELCSALLGIRRSLRESAGGEQDLLRISDDAIVQEYVSPPLLLNGLKFDFRLYVFVCPAEDSHISMEDLGPGFLCREGLARFCTKPYAHLRDNKSDWVDAHLTNTSVSMTSSTFQPAKDPDDGENGSKRKVSAVLKCLEKQGVLSTTSFWQAVEVLVSTVLRRLTPAIYEHAAAPETYTTPPFPGIDGHLSSRVAPQVFAQAFNLLGVDVILNAHGEPFLLEVNAAPSLGVDDVVPLSGPADGVNCKAQMGRPRWAVYHDGANWGQRCRCPDMHSRHKHELSAIDVAIKSVVARGALQILNARARGAPATTWADGTSYSSLQGVPTKYL